MIDSIAVARKAARDTEREIEAVLTSLSQRTGLPIGDVNIEFNRMELLVGPNESIPTVKIKLDINE